MIPPSFLETLAWVGLTWRHSLCFLALGLMFVFPYWRHVAEDIAPLAELAGGHWTWAVLGRSERALLIGGAPVGAVCSGRI